MKEEKEDSGVLNPTLNLTEKLSESVETLSSPFTLLSSPHSSPRFKHHKFYVDTIP